jgi:hypothetical protein
MQPPVDPDLEHLGVGLKATMAIAGGEAIAGRSSAEKSESFEVATATLAGALTVSFVEAGTACPGAISPQHYARRLIHTISSMWL